MEVIKTLLSEGIRADGRKLEDQREIALEFGSSYGQVHVSMGKTKLMVQISASVRKPLEDRPFEGSFVVATDLSSMASPRFENGRPKGDEISLTRLVEKAVRRSNALDLESLCIEAGKRCWQIRADVHYIDYDGGLVDATCAGVIAGLLHFRRPDTSIVNGRTIVHTHEERAPVPLSVLHVPISTTWSFLFDDIRLVDATAEEQDYRHGDMTITANKDGQICQIQKAGGMELDVDDITDCCHIAIENARRISSLIQENLAKDNQLRHAGNKGMAAENDR